MKHTVGAFTIAAIFVVASPAVANEGAGIRRVSDRSRVGEPYRGDAIGRHDSRPRLRSGDRERRWFSGSYPLEYEDRDRGVYLGQRHDD